MLVLTPLVGCAGGKPGAPALSGHAPAQNELPENPLLASVPDDTPYAFATFKPLPVELFDQMSAMYRPMFARLMKSQGDEGAKVRALVDEIGTLNAQRFEELGLSTKARMVIYGLGPYPVLRAEVRDGDALFAFIQRVVSRWGAQLPRPVEEHGRKIWRFDDAKVGVIIALGKTEVVAAMAPPAELDRNRALIIGEQRPARSLPTARFRDIARRDGYSAQAIGFLELPRFVTAIVAASGNRAPPAACTAAIVGIAQQVPRLTMGYDELTRKRVSGGMVLELAPEALAEARKLSVKLAGIDRLNAQQPLFGIAAAGDVAQARKLLGKVANVFRGLGDACAERDSASAASELDAAASRPLPPYLEGLSGVIVAMTSFESPKDGPKKLEGWGVVRIADTDELLAMVAREAPGLELKPDGIARPLPESAAVKGAVAASRDAVAMALGTDSERRASEALRGTPGPAPLVIMQLDIARVMETFGDLGDGSEASAAMREAYKLYGASTITLDVDDRGLVGWASFELR